MTHPLETLERLRIFRAAIVALLLIRTSICTGNDEFRFHRGLKTVAGWSRLDLPLDVLAHCRPDLSDLRILAGASEVPYVHEEDLGEAAVNVEFTNVESKPGLDTVAVLDRGEHRSSCTSIDVTVAGDEPFLKPVVLEASDDRSSFRSIAQGSIFRTQGSQMLKIRFAQNDRRYLRLRLDDRQSAKVLPVAALFQREAPQRNNQELSFQPQTIPSADNSVDAYSLHLPSANLNVVSLALDVRDPAFSRSLRVYESIIFRGELTRRLVGEGLVSRSPSGTSAVSLSLGSVLGRELEIEIEHLTTRLELKEIHVTIRPRRLLFLAPSSPQLSLVYGSNSSKAPKYDLLAALTSGRPERFNDAHLSAPQQEQKIADKSLLPARGPQIVAKDWAHRQALRLPSGTRIAYLDLPGKVLAQLSSVRICNHDLQQIPYVVESLPRQLTRALQFRVKPGKGLTEIVVSGLNPETPLESIHLAASAPEYFERRIQVSESISDARGTIGKRLIGQAVWLRRNDDPTRDLSIPLDRPRNKELSIDIEDGDNPTLTLTGVVGHTSTRRIDFVVEPGDALFLYWGNPSASAPRYDLALIADAVLSSAALSVSLGAIEDTAPARSTTPHWFWWATVGAGFIVVFVLARTLRSAS
jgi:hypothetical protein